MSASPSLIAALPKALKVLRGERSQEEIAAICGKTQTWWSYLESGARNPRLPDLILLSQRFGLNMIAGKWEVTGATSDDFFDPTDLRNALSERKMLLDLLSWVPGWTVMQRAEVDRILNECEALRIERDAADAAIDEAYNALARGDATGARLTLSANRVEVAGA